MIVLLPFVILGLLQLYFVQNLLKNITTDYLQKKLHTTVSIEEFRMSWFSELRLKGVLLEDRQQQTLFYSGELVAHYDLLQLLHKKLVIHSLQWKQVKADISRGAGDSSFNYQFILDAFAGPDKAPDTTSGSSLRYSIDTVQFSQFNLQYNDIPGRMKAIVRFDSIGILPDEINTDSMRFTLHDLLVSGLHTTIQLPPSVEADTSGASPEQSSSGLLPYLAAGKITIRNSDALFDSGSGFATNDTIGLFTVSRLQLALANNRITADTLYLADTYSAIRLKNTTDTLKAKATEEDTASAAYFISASRLMLQRTRFRMDNDAPPSPYQHAMDYNHLFINPLEADIGQVVYNVDTLTAAIRSIAMQEQSGFAVKQFHADVRYDPSTILLDSLLLITNNSYLADTLEVKVPSWSTVADHLNELQLKVNLTRSRIDLHEAVYFAPTLAKNPSLKPMLSKQLQIDAQLYGSLANLRIPHFYCNDQDGNLLQIDGNVQNAGLPEQILADVTIRSLRSGNKPLRSWLAPHTLPDNITLPAVIAINGPLKASRQILQTNLHIHTSDGNLLLKAAMSQYMDSIRSRYNIAFRTEGIPAGKLTGDTSLGTVAFNGTVEGKGWQLQTMDARASLQIPLLEYNHYTYRQTAFDATIADSRYTFNGGSADTAATFNVQLNGSLDSLHPSVLGDINIPEFNLLATHWSDDTLTIKSNMHIALTDLQPYHLNGGLNINELQLYTSQGVIPIDTIRLQASDSLDQQSIALSGFFGEMNAQGHFDYTSIHQPLLNIVRHHLLPADSAAVQDTIHTHQDMTLTASLVWPASLQKLLPDLNMRQPAAFYAHINTDSFLLASQLNIPALRYGDFQLDSLSGQFNIDRDSLAADVDLHRLQHPRFPLEETTLHLSARNGIIDADLALQDKTRRPKYLAGLQLSMLPDNSYHLKLHPRLLLNGQSWSVPPDNIITIEQGKLKEARLSLTNNEQQLSVMANADSSGHIPPIEVKLHQLDLSSLTSLVASDTALAGGIANGNASIRNWDQSPLIDASLRIDSLRIMRALLGDLSLQAANTTADDYRIKLGLQGAGNNIGLEGVYHNKSEAPFDFKLQLHPLHLPALEPLARDYVKQLAGDIEGDMTIRGSSAKPQLLGDLGFKNAGFNATAINSFFNLYDEHISFQNDGIHLQNFVLADSAGNEAVLNGSILTRDYQNFRFNLNLVTDNFEVLGYQQSNDQLFYGPAYIDSKIEIRGTPSLPRINMNLKLRENSHVTFAIPESQPGIADREGVVKFIDKSQPVDSSLLNTRDTLSAKSRLKGIAFSGNLEVTPDASIKIIIDPQNGDSLMVKGNANLNATLDPGGNIILTGQYQIQQGKYEMSLNQLIKRSFDVQKGSTITWEGEPTKATVDITAMYLANAPAIDLVADQLTNATPEMRTRYKQKLPIQVYLIIKGDMLKPDISFRLDMPEDHQADLGGAVYTRLKQINLIPSELNKQVMGLLVLNSFIPDNPMDILNNGSGGGLEQTARQSVSKILSQQLNNLAASLIKGVDINFDLQSQQDYSTGSAQNSTTLNVGVSKHLFNDRLTVSVGNNFALEGNSQDASGIAGNVSIEYALTKDGRYRLRAYRKNETEEIIQGQIVETGITFSLVMDYNEFRELFERVKKEKKIRLRNNKK